MRCRRGAGAGGEAPLAIQGIPAGAQRVPAATAQTTQVSLLSHVTTPAGLNPAERWNNKDVDYSWTLLDNVAEREHHRLIPDVKHLSTSAGKTTTSPWAIQSILKTQSEFNSTVWPLIRGSVIDYISTGSSKTHQTRRGRISSHGVKVASDLQTCLKTNQRFVDVSNNIRLKM